MTFYVGQKVVCVDASNTPGRRWRRGEAPVEGQVYTVVEVCVSISPGPKCLILVFKELKRCRELYGMVARHGVEREPGYVSTRFRPVVDRRTDISIFKAMLNPANETVDA